MGGSASRDRDSRRQQTNVPVVRQQQQAPPPQQYAALPQHLASQFSMHQRPQQNPPPSALAAPQRQQQATHHLPQATAVQEGQKIKLLATIEPSTVRYDPATKTLTFFLTSTADLCFYEIHTGIRESIRGGEVVYTPNKPKARPATVTVEGSCENREINVVLNTTGMEAQELTFNKQFQKQKPCSIVLRYCDDEGDHAEHTSIDLGDAPGRKGRVLNQIVATGGACYLVENLFGADSEVTLGSVMNDEGKPPAASPGNDGSPTSVTVVDDDDALCVICITNDKDTAVLPCRHMCLCKGCAQELMRHTPKCPVCRGPISQLLHMPK